MPDDRAPGTGNPPWAGNTPSPNPNAWQKIEPTGNYRVRQTIVFPSGTVVTGAQQIGPTPNTLPNEDPGFIPAQVTPLPDLVPGEDAYDWHRLNDILIAAGMNGWQIVAAANGSHQPIAIQKTVANPAWQNMTDEERAANPSAQFTSVPSGEFVITAKDPNSNTVRKLTVGRAGDASNYSYALLDSEDIVKSDPNKQGYSSPQRLPLGDHEEVWGVNNTNGRFERIPDVPNITTAANKNWTSVQLIDMPDGSRQWWGTPPEGGTPRLVPDMPVMPAKQGYENIIQQRVGNELVYRGWNTATKKYEDVVGLSREPAPVQTTTIGSITYQPDANGQLRPAPGVAQPVEGVSTRWVPAEPGFAKKQNFENGEWHDDIKVTHLPVSTEAARTEGAIKPKGERYRVQQTVSGVLMWVPVIARGDGTYDPDPDGKLEPVAGQPSPSMAQAVSGTEEFQQRYDPTTGQYATTRNPNYAPTLIADRTRQLKQLAGDKQRELNAKISKDYPREQALADFNQWWDTELGPREKQLQFDVEQQRLKGERDQQTQQATNLTTASNLGQAAVERYQAMQKNMVGPGYAQQMRGLTEAIAAGKPAPPLDVSAFQFKGPDLNELHQYYTAMALQHISPTAAGIMSAQPGAQPGAQPALLGLDPRNLINRSAYEPGRQININISGGGGDTPAVTTTPPPPAAVAPALPAAPAPAAPGVDLGRYSNLMPPFHGPVFG